MIRRPPRSTLFPYNDALPIYPVVAGHNGRIAKRLWPDRAGITRFAGGDGQRQEHRGSQVRDRKSTRLNSSHDQISYAVFCLKKKKMYSDQAKTSHDFDVVDDA